MLLFVEGKVCLQHIDLDLLVVRELLPPAELVRIPFQQSGMGARGSVIVAVEVHQHRDLINMIRVPTLKANDGGGMRFELLKIIHALANQNELAVLTHLHHVGLNKYLEILPHSLVVIIIDLNNTLEAIAAVTLHDKVVKDHRGVPFVDLALHEIVLGLLAPCQCELVHLITMGEEWVANCIVE